MTNERYLAEQSVLRNKLAPNLFKFLDMGTRTPHLVLAARTNRGNVYTLRIELEDFPENIPKVFVTRMLKDKKGNDLDSCSACMHTLTSEHGRTRICHFGFDSWHPEVSLYKVFIKSRLWLEMYEQHLRTGKDIDYYLNHQE